MMDSIFVKQNEPHLLKCIAAQRKEYDKAKKKEYFKEVLTAVFAVLSIVASVIDNDILTAVVFLFAGIMTIACKYIDIHAYRHKETAADIQQYIDVTLFRFILKDDTNDWGVLPTYSRIAETISEVSDDDVNNVKDWYSDYSFLSPIEQVFSCQKENIRWDKKLRQEFKTIITISVIIIIMILFGIAIYINPSVVRIICVISWSLPLVDVAYSFWKKIKKDSDRLNLMNERCYVIEHTISQLSDDQNFDSSIKKIRLDLIDLQKQIYTHRKHSTLIPNLFYKLRQKQYQATEDKIALETKNMVS